MKPRIAAVILAAGKGSRMCSPRAKVLHTVAGKSMLARVIFQARKAMIAADIVVVIGHQREQVRDEALKHDPDAHFALQLEQLGTGHAVVQAIGVLDKIGADRVVVLSGDVPLLQSPTIDSLLTTLNDTGAQGVVLSAIVDEPFGLGRIVRAAENGAIQQIVEQKDCTKAEAAICEINSGVYAFEWRALRSVLSKIGSDNAQREYYLTDAVRLLLAQGDRVVCKTLNRAENEQIVGVNTPQQLQRVNEIANNASRH